MSEGEKLLKLRGICGDHKKEIPVSSEGAVAAKPGVTGAHIEDVCEEGLRKRGVDITFTAGRVGRGIGMLFTKPPALPDGIPWFWPKTWWSALSRV